MTKLISYNKNDLSVWWAEVAQSVEQGTENPRVGSSILSLGTHKIRLLEKIKIPFKFLVPIWTEIFQIWPPYFFYKVHL